MNMTFNDSIEMDIPEIGCPIVVTIIGVRYEKLCPENVTYLDYDYYHVDAVRVSSINGKDETLFIPVPNQLADHLWGGYIEKAIEERLDKIKRG